MLSRCGETTLSLISSFEVRQTLTELGSSAIIAVRGAPSCRISINKLIPSGENKCINQDDKWIANSWTENKWKR